MSLAVDRQPIDLATLPQNLHKHLDPAAPPPLKMMAARGMLPVLPEQNLAMLYMLALGTDATAQAEAVATLQQMPSDIVVPALGKTAHDGTLDWVAEQRANDPFTLDAIVTNRAAHDHTIARIARLAGPNLCDVIAMNQVRILQAPVILEQMYQNAHARMATVDRLVELLQRQNVELKGLPGLQAAMASGQDIFGKAGDDNAEVFKSQSAIADEEQQLIDNLDSMSRSEKERLLDEFAEQKDDSPLYARVAMMSISERIRLATVGGREALNLLVRDPNKLVHMAAVRSPRVQFPDVRAWARMKSLPDGVVSYIASQKDYTRYYDVMHALCMNPKTPLTDTMKFLNHLRTNHLRSLSSDRTIPSQVSRQAKQLYQKRSGA